MKEELGISVNSRFVSSPLTEIGPMSALPLQRQDVGAGYVLVIFFVCVCVKALHIWIPPAVPHETSPQMPHLPLFESLPVGRV